jgi:hypothetical protein
VTVPLSAALAQHAVAVLLALALGLQSVELLSVRSDFAGNGVFVWGVLRSEFRALPRPLRALLDVLLNDRSFPALLALQLAFALALPWTTRPLVPLCLFVTALLVCVRFRGTYNGGSDAMTLVLVLGSVIARLGPEVAPGGQPSSVWQRAGLGYIAAQLVLSYFLAGISKLRSSSWRRGLALPRLLRAHAYAVPVPMQDALTGSTRALLTSWLVMLFECLFPVAPWLGPAGCALVLTFGVAFHAFNAVALGLNRFLWAWLAAYPALLFWSTQLAA